MLSRLRALREAAGLSPQNIADRLILGPGWVELYESGETEIPLGLMLAILAVSGSRPGEFFDGLPEQPGADAFGRSLRGEPSGKNLIANFTVGRYAAQIELPDVSQAQWDDFLKTFRDALVNTDRSEAVVNTFLSVVETWTQVNPSDLWYFVLPQAFQDRYNHPADSAGLDLSQSWKRTSGWALESVFARHYNKYLVPKGVELQIPPASRKVELLTGLGLGHQVQPEKADILLVGKMPDGSESCFGVAHVKASFAERRTDDVPLSQALIAKGFTSPLLTMDCKATPAARPVNRGELGEVFEPESDRPDPRGPKRLDIERDRKFDACFSYNQRTRETPQGLQAAARVYVCDFANPNDAFAAHVLSGWRRLLGP